MGRPGAVYATADSLYVASRHQYGQTYGWFYDDGEATPDATTIHKFALSENAAPSAYLGSGVVKGRVLNQFALSEHEGYLRVATTTGHLPDPDTHNTVASLKQEGGELVVKGMVDHLAPGEDIRSARFYGDVGFVVTFKKTDPLYTIDFSEPEAPRVRGELKIPGFSTYMHMIDEGHVMSIGYDADDQGDFAWFQGILLQIFDVTDLDAPTLTHKEVIGTRGSASDAATNHLAFNYFTQRGLLGIPMVICEGGSGGDFGDTMTFSGLLVYKVDPGAGFTSVGGVPHPLPDASADGNGPSCGNWWSSATSFVKRSVFMEDYVYSVSEDEIRVANISDLAAPKPSCRSSPERAPRRGRVQSPPLWEALSPPRRAAGLGGRRAALSAARAARDRNGGVLLGLVAVARFSGRHARALWALAVRAYAAAAAHPVTRRLSARFPAVARVLRELSAAEYLVIHLGLGLVLSMAALVFVRSRRGCARASRSWASISRSRARSTRRRAAPAWRRSAPSRSSAASGRSRCSRSSWPRRC